MLLLTSSVCGLFKWRQFEPEVILLAVGWYLRFSLSYREVEELLAERGLRADPVTVWRWVQSGTPMILFQNIVEILHGSMAAVFLQRSFGFQLHDCRRVSNVLVGVDDPRAPDGSNRPKALARKRSAAASRLAERRKSIVAPLESTARYKYTHLPLTRM